MYQSNWFEGKFPQDNEAFQKVVYTKKKETIEESLKEMRKHMIEDYAYKAGIFRPAIISLFIILSLS